MLTAAIFAAALTTAPDPDLSWISGYWLDCSGGREASETWSDPRGGLMVGHAVTLTANDGVSFETARIGPTAQGFAYVAQPGGAAPTAFALSETGPARAVFVNAENDFPTRIIYATEGDVLTARIEGTIDGQTRSMDWTFRAAPLNARCAF